MSKQTLRLCTAVLLSSFCFFLAVPLIPLYVIELGPDSIFSGPAIAVSFILSALLSPVWARLANRFGPKPMMIRAAVLVSVAYAFSAVSTSVEMLFLSRCFAGVASGFVPVATGALARFSDESTRSTDMGWLSSAKSAGALLGPALGGGIVWATDSFRVAFAIAAGASLVTAAIAISMPALAPTDSQARAGTAEGFSGYRDVVPLALLLTLLLTTAGMLLQIWLPFAISSAQDAAGAAGITGLILACASAFTMVLAPLWGRLADRRPRGEIFVMTVVGPLPIFIVLAVVSPVWSVALLFVACAVLGSEALAILGGEVSRKLPEGLIGPYFGWSNTFAQAGSAVAAILVPPLAVHSIKLPIWVCVGLYVTCAALSVGLFRNFKTKPTTKGDVC